MAIRSRCRSFLFLLLLFVSSVSTAAEGLIGVDYGRVANNLMPPERVVELLKAQGIGAVSIFDADRLVLRAFANSGIKIVVSLPNEQLAAATNPDYARTWVWENVKAYYPATQITSIAVGNEVFHQLPALTSSLVPAMQNVYNGLANLGLADAIKVSTPVSFSAVNISFPPSQGSFRRDLQPVLRQMLDFLSRTGSYFMVTLYPYITYKYDPNVNLEYALGLPNPGVWDPYSKRTYYSLLDAQLDAFYSAVADLGFGVAVTNAGAAPSVASQKQHVGSGVNVKETGWPSNGENQPPKGRKVAVEKAGSTVGGLLNVSLAAEWAANVDNARAYNSNLVRRILDGKTGTPLHPDADMDVYIFSLFNENLKPGPDSERNYGLFYPNGTKVYDVPWPRGSGDSWCVADPAVGQQRMRGALDWACGQGGANCGPIQPGGPCYQPNTMVAHASYAMNSYYQKQNRIPGTCDFSGVGRVVYRRPRFGKCNFPS